MAAFVADGFLRLKGSEHTRTTSEDWTMARPRPKTDEEKNLWFWRMGTVQFSNQVTEFTPKWCEEHQWASDQECLVCSDLQRKDFS